MRQVRPGQPADVRPWPIKTEIALEPNVGFRRTADIVRSEQQADR